MNKERIRKEAIARRDQLSKEECSNRSLLISQHFFNTSLFQVDEFSVIHLFLPIKDKKEVNTNFIFEKLKLEFPNVKIALSVSDFSDYSMRFFEYKSETILIENKFGIPEPIGGVEISSKSVEVIIIPLLAVDQNGNRIGYGKGFYDRLLPKCNPNCLKIGLSFEEPISSIQPDEYDIPLDICISPEKVTVFKKK